MKFSHFFFSLLFTLCFLVHSFAQKTLISKSYGSTYYEMGEWIEEWDSIHYIFTENNTHILESFKPVQSNSGLFRMTGLDNYYKENHYRENFNQQITLKDWNERIYIDGKLMEISKCNALWDFCRYKIIYEYDEDLLIGTSNTSFDTQTQEWKINFEQYFDYDEQNQLIEIYAENFYNNSLTFKSLDSFFYDAGNMVVNKSYRAEISEPLEIRTKTEIYRNASSIDSSLFYRLTNGELKLKEKNILFNNENRLDSIWRYYRNTSIDALDPIPLRFLYLYDQDDNLIKEELFLSYTNDKHTFSYFYLEPGFVSRYEYLFEHQEEGQESGYVNYFYGDPILDIKSTSNVNEHHLKLYPNPSNRQINFDLKHDMDRLLIFSSDGQLIFEAYNRPNKSLDVSFLAEGVYTIKISSNALIYSSRFVKI